MGRFTDSYDIKTNATTNTHLSNPASNRFTTTSTDIGNQKDYIKENFGNATQNVINFQAKFTTDDTFKTTAQVSYKLKDTALTADKDALENYRENATNGNHNFARSYLGAAPFVKSTPEE